MSFGKPQLSAKPVRCLNCGEEYPENRIILKHAGRTEKGDFWNDECPECGAINSHVDSADMTDEEFREEQHEVVRIRHEMRKNSRR